MSQSVFIFHLAKSIGKKLSNEHYKVYIAQKLITVWGFVWDIAKNTQWNRFFTKNLENSFDVPVVCKTKKKIRQLILDNVFVFLKTIARLFWSFLTVFKKFDFHLPSEGFRHLCLSMIDSQFFSNKISKEYERWLFLEFKF